MRVRKVNHPSEPDVHGFGLPSFLSTGCGAASIERFAKEGKRGACGVSAPHDEILLFRQKDPKPWAPGRGPWGAFAPVPTVRAAELASLRQSSPPNRLRDWGAATPAGAGNWRGDECKRQRLWIPDQVGDDGGREGENSRCDGMVGNYIFTLIVDFQPRARVAGPFSTIWLSV